ncbi:methyltransferase [Streptomyces sp. NPDC088789]|uniref:methyltransferase n=1 Tax=Streptomyces sp. NPDC088789 TaxID=3365899 RepID=UPI003804A254
MTPEAEFSEAVSGLAPIALRTAATLRLADHIAAGHNTATLLADRIGADSDVLGRVLRFLVVRGVFGEPEPDVFALTPLSVTLLDGHPSKLCAWLDEGGIGGRMDTATRALTVAVRTGRSPYASIHGDTFYQDLAKYRSGPDFNTLRQSHSESFADEITAVFPWEGVQHVVDVGGGTGAFPEALMRRYSGLHTTLVDLPDAVAAAVRRITAAGLEKRFTAAPGSFFHPLPSGADVYTLINVLHNWNDDDAVRILRRCAEAADRNSTVVVVERLIDGADQRAITTMDLRMLLLLSGKERSLTQLRGVAEAAGLVHGQRSATAVGLDWVTFHTSGTQQPAADNRARGPSVLSQEFGSDIR